MARQIARSWEGRTSRRLRKKIEMLFAHLKRILKLDRLRLRGPNGARDEFILAAKALNLCWSSSQHERDPELAGGESALANTPTLSRPTSRGARYPTVFSQNFALRASRASVMS